MSISGKPDDRLDETRWSPARGLAWLVRVLFRGRSGASYNVYICGSWSNNQGPLVPAAAPGMSAGASNCGGGFAAHLDLSKPGLAGVPNGQGASWTATAPPGLTITHIYTVNDFSAFVGGGNGWWGEFFWNGGPGPAGRSAQITDSFQTYGCCQASFNNQTVGWFIVVAHRRGVVTLRRSTSAGLTWRSTRIADPGSWRHPGCGRPRAGFAIVISSRSTATRHRGSAACRRQSTDRQ